MTICEDSLLMYESLQVLIAGKFDIRSGSIGLGGYAKVKKLRSSGEGEQSRACKSVAL